MAKKGKNSDEFDFGDEGYSDDFGGDFDLDADDLFAEQGNDRKTIVESASGALKDAFLNTDPDAVKERAKKAIEAALPDKLRVEYDSFNKLYDGVTEAIDKNTQSITKDLKSVGKKLDVLLPKEGMLRDLFSKVYTSAEMEAKEAYVSEEQRKNQEILDSVQSALGDFTQVQEQTTALNQVLEDKRTASTNEILKVVARNTQATKVFNFEYTSKYQKKSLELQFRTVGLLKDILQFSQASNKDIIQQLINISKNTSLPDIVKQRQSELLMRDFQGKIRDRVLGSFMDKGGLWDKITENAIARINNIGAQAREYIGTIDDVAGIGESMFGDPDSMMGMSASDMAMSFGADAARDFADASIAKRLGNKLFGTKYGKKAIRLIKSFYEDPSQSLNDAAEKVKNKGFFGKFFSKILGEAAGIAKVGVDKKNFKLTRFELDQPSPFDYRTKISINRVIPGYLRKILAETYANRMGFKEDNTRAFELVYNHDTDTFVKSVNVGASLKKFIAGNVRKKTEYSRNRLTGLLKNEGLEKRLRANGIRFSRAELDTISKAAMVGSTKNNVGGLRFLQSKEFLQLLPPELRSKMEKSMEHIYDHADNDEWFQDEIRDSVDQLRRTIPGFNREIEALFKDGKVDQLKALGLIKYNRETREYEPVPGAMEKLMFDQFGLDHAAVADMSSSNLVDVKKTLKKSEELVVKGKDKLNNLIKKGYDALPETMKKDLQTLGNKAKNVGNKALDVGNNIFEGAKARANKEYFTKGGYKKDIQACITFVEQTAYPKVKSMVKDFGTTALSYLPKPIKDKIEGMTGGKIDAIKKWSSAKIEQMLDRLEPDEKAKILDAVAKAKQIKFSKVEQGMINLVKKGGTKVQEAIAAIKGLDADIIYNKARNTMATIFTGSNEDRKQLLMQATNFGKQGLKNAWNTVSGTAKSASSSVASAGSIAYRAMLDPEIRKTISAAATVTKAKVEELTPDVVNELIETGKIKLQAAKANGVSLANMSPEEREQVIREYFNKTGIGAKVKSAWGWVKSKASSAVSSAGKSIKQIEQTIKDKASAIQALKAAAETNDPKVVAETIKEIQSADPEIANAPMVKDAVSEAIRHAEQSNEFGEDLMKELKKEKDPVKSAGILGNIMGTAWKFLPIRGAVGLAFKGVGFYMKTLWNIEKFLWKNVYGKIFGKMFGGIGSAIAWPFKKLFGIGKKKDDNSKKGFLRRAGSLMASPFSWMANKFFKKKKKVINGVEVDEDEDPRKKDKGGILGWLKKLGPKLMLLASGAMWLFNKLKTPGKWLGTLGKSLGSGIFKVFREYLPKLFGSIGRGLMGVFNRFMPGVIQSAVGMAAKGLGLIKDAAAGAGNVVKNLATTASNKVSSFFGWVGDKLTSAKNAVVDAGKYVANKAKGLADMAANMFSKAWNKVKVSYKYVTEDLFNRIVNGLKVFKEKASTMLFKRIGRSRGLKLLAKLGAKIGARLIPGAGWALLAVDVGLIGYIMINDKKSLLSAIAINYIGFDIWDDHSEPVLNEDMKEPDDPVGENGVTILPDKQKLEAHANATPKTQEQAKQEVVSKSSSAKDKESTTYSSSPMPDTGNSYPSRWNGTMFERTPSGIGLDIDTKGMKTMAYELIAQGEGYRAEEYNDTKGIPTIGYGRNLWAHKFSSDEKRRFRVGRKIIYPEKPAREWMETHVDKVYNKIKNEKWFKIHDPVRQAAILDIVYNLGLEKWKDFGGTKRKLEAKNYVGAAGNLRRTKWYKDVKGRGVRNVAIIEHGMFPGDFRFTRYNNPLAGRTGISQETASEEKQQRRELQEEKKEIKVASNNAKPARSSSSGSARASADDIRKANSTSAPLAKTTNSQSRHVATANNIRDNLNIETDKAEYKKKALAAIKKVAQEGKLDEKTLVKLAERASGFNPDLPLFGLSESQRHIFSASSLSKKLAPNEVFTPSDPMHQAIAAAGIMAVKGPEIINSAKQLSGSNSYSDTNLALGFKAAYDPIAREEITKAISTRENLRAEGKGNIITATTGFDKEFVDSSKTYFGDSVNAANETNNLLRQANETLQVLANNTQGNSGNKNNQTQVSSTPKPSVNVTRAV